MRARRCRPRRPGSSLRSQRVPQGPRGGLARARRLVGQVERRGVCALVARRAAAAAAALPRRAVVAVGRAHHRARPQSAPLSGESGAAGLSRGLRAARSARCEGLRDFLPARPAGRGARRARWHILLATLALLVGVAAGFMLTVRTKPGSRRFVPAGLAGGRGTGEHRGELLDKEIFAPWPGSAKAFACSPMCCSAQHAGRHHDVRARPRGRHADADAHGLSGAVARRLPRPALRPRPDVDFLGWISIHGTTELGASCSAGAAGFC